MLGHERLVGGHHLLAALDGGPHEGARGVGSTDDLHHDVDLGVGQDLLGVEAERPRRGLDLAGLLVVAGHDLADLDGGAEPLLDGRRVPLEKTHDALPNDAVSDEADADRSRCHPAEPLTHRKRGRKVGVTAAVWLLIGWILVGAALLVVHLVLLWLCVRAPNLSLAMKLLSLVPVATPVVGWVSGLRVQPILWVVLLGVYVALRLSFAG